MDAEKKLEIPEASPWMTVIPACEYVTRGHRTPGGYRKFSPRFLRHEVEAGRLRAARVGGRGQLLFRREWLDEWIDRAATPVMVSSSVRRRV